MEHENNIILLKTENRNQETADFAGKTYRGANADEIDSAKTYRESEKVSESDTQELESSLFVDLLADENGRKSAIAIIKSDSGRRTVVNAISSNGLDKAKAIIGLNAVLHQYHSGEIIRMRAMCETAAASVSSASLSRDFLERSIVPMLVELGIIIRSGERTAYWQPHDLIGQPPTIRRRIRKLFELTPEQQELKRLADEAYAEQQKLKALETREAYMLQQKQAYARLSAHQQQLDGLAAKHQPQKTLMDKAKANPGAILLIGSLAVFGITGLIAGKRTDDTPMPTVNAAMQAPAPQPDAGAVQAWETEQIRQQMLGNKP